MVKDVVQGLDVFLVLWIGKIVDLLLLLKDK
jgi:hypothetical protein